MALASVGLHLLPERGYLGQRFEPLDRAPAPRTRTALIFDRARLAVLLRRLVSIAHRAMAFVLGVVA